MNQKADTPLQNGRLMANTWVVFQLISAVVPSHSSANSASCKLLQQAENMRHIALAGHITAGGVGCTCVGGDAMGKKWGGKGCSAPGPASCLLYK